MKPKSSPAKRDPPWDAWRGLRSWMSNPVFYVVGALLALSVVLAVLSFTVFHITALGVVFVIAAVILLALLLWCAWIRRQYAFGGGGMMERTHLVILSHLDFDGRGSCWKWLRLRAIIHPGGSHLAVGPGGGH